jgi:hypothetical protein
MIVFIVEVQCPSDTQAGQRLFRVAVRTENEARAAAIVANGLRLHISMIVSCRPSDEQAKFDYLAANKPVIIYAPGE